MIESIIIFAAVAVYTIVFYGVISEAAESYVDNEISKMRNSINADVSCNFRKVAVDVKSLDSKLNGIQSSLDKFKDEIGHNGIADAINKLKDVVGKENHCDNPFDVFSRGFSLGIAPKPTIIERLDAMEKHLGVRFESKIDTKKGYVKSKNK